MPFVSPPSVDRGGIDGLPDLPGAGCFYIAMSSMKFETAVLPLEIAMVEQAASLGAGVLHH